MTGRSLVMGVLGLVVGVAVGGRVTGGGAAPAGPAPAQAVRGELTRLDVAAAVRAELARTPRTPAPAPAPAVVAVAPEPAAAPAEPEPPAADVVARAERAADILDGALDRGTWTDADADAMRPQIANLPADQAMPIMIRMSDAVTRGELVLETAGMPL